MNYSKTIIYNIKKYLNLILHLQFKYKAEISDVSADVLIKIDNYYTSINYIFCQKSKTKQRQTENSFAAVLCAYSI
ncbi:MAG: hypothetical protein EGQ91_00550 [Clostridiales bacterium]|nr:hypothetical protein [Clostridiales bacterium]